VNHIVIVTPARRGSRTGNRHTALRWAAMLRGPRTRVSVVVEWDGKPCDVLIALHARRSSDSVFRFKKQYPRMPAIVVLTGTDLYRDLPGSAAARRSLRLADRIIVLQEEARRRLAKTLRKRTRVVYQSSHAAARHAPPKGELRIVVVGNLRKEKDPFRAALALAHVDRVKVVQVGDALDPSYAGKAKALMKKEPRYRWVGGCSHARALGWIAHSHLLVVSSVMEGGANVICEAARIGTPVLASRVSGNIGMLGKNYPGYFRLHDEKDLARQIEKHLHKKTLRRHLAARRHLFAPAAEKRALRAVLRELGSA
jgi:putative glycosyltransferase (TIGR04348 family)